MRFKIATLLGLMFLVSIALSIFYKPHPSNVMEMLDYIENLPDTIRDGKFPERPGQLTAQTMNRRPDHLELFCPMTGDYYLETWIDEDNRLNDSGLIGIAVIKRQSKGKWKYVYPVYFDGDLHWNYETEAPDPFEYYHTALNGSDLKQWCNCPDCVNPQSNG